MIPNSVTAFNEETQRVLDSSSETISLKTASAEQSLEEVVAIVFKNDEYCKLEASRTNRITFSDSNNNNKYKVPAAEPLTQISEVCTEHEQSILPKQKLYA